MPHAEVTLAGEGMRGVELVDRVRVEPILHHRDRVGHRPRPARGRIGLRVAGREVRRAHDPPGLADVDLPRTVSVVGKLVLAEAPLRRLLPHRLGHPRIVLEEPEHALHVGPVTAADAVAGLGRAGRPVPVLLGQVERLPRVAVLHVIVVDHDLPVGRPPHLDHVAEPLHVPLLHVGEQVAVVRGVEALRLLDRHAVAGIVRERETVGEGLDATVSLACRSGQHLLRRHFHVNPAREPLAVFAARLAADSARHARDRREIPLVGRVDEHAAGERDGFAAGERHGDDVRQP